MQVNKEPVGYMINTAYSEVLTHNVTVNTVSNTSYCKVHANHNKTATFQDHKEGSTNLDEKRAQWLGSDNQQHVTHTRWWHWRDQTQANPVWSFTSSSQSIHLLENVPQIKLTTTDMVLFAKSPPKAQLCHKLMNWSQLLTGVAPIVNAGMTVKFSQHHVVVKDEITEDEVMRSDRSP